MKKIDFKKEWKHLYSPPAGKVTLVEVPKQNYLMIDGRGDPNTSPAYQQAIEALFSLSFALKFLVKRSTGVDFTVMPLEGLWWMEDPRIVDPTDKSKWYWTAMILQPPPVKPEFFESAREQVEKKKELAALQDVRLGSLHEGLAAQFLHVGPYANEATSVEKLHRFIEENGYYLNGKHHEIYLSDPRRTPPEKWKTILRQPIRKEV